MKKLLLCFLLSCTPHSYFQAIGPTYPAISGHAEEIPIRYRYRLQERGGQLLGLFHGFHGFHGGIAPNLAAAMHGGNYYVIIGDTVEVWKLSSK